MNRTQSSVVLIFCCAVGSVLLTGDRRGWWAHNTIAGSVLPIVLLAVGLIVFAAGWKNTGHR